MDRTVLVAEAKAAGQAAERNLQMIARQPERMTHPKKLVDGITYLNTMIKFAEEEKKNVRLAGRTLGLRTHLKNLVVSILTPESHKGKGETA